MTQLASIENLMTQSGVKFGTSGARGLAEAMTNRICYAYTKAFLQHLKAMGELGGALAVAGDLRPSTARIMSAAAMAGHDMGLDIIHCGRIPSPALALEGMRLGIPTVMVTGSHIPADRNGIKYTRSIGEINKNDEAGIRAQSVDIPSHVTECDNPFELGPIDRTAEDSYKRRYRDFFGENSLDGLHLGLYQHSTVGRDILEDIFLSLGARVTPLARSETFVPVDTEAIRPEDCELALRWSNESGFDAIVSADGDCDRPLLSDEKGQWLRGDVLGILCASWLGADAISVPVSCNTAVEKSHRFNAIERTKIGSPFVIAGMESLGAAGHQRVMGYEANGGFLQYSPVEKNGKSLSALPTRDAVTPVVSSLLLAKQRKLTVSGVIAELPERFTASNRVENFPTTQSLALIEKYAAKGFDHDAFRADFGHLCGVPASADKTDGLRVTFENSEIIHLRPSGNAPELRCYCEAGSQLRVSELINACMSVLSGLVS